MNLEELLIHAEVHYENALDDMYYGYGYKFWREHYGCDELSEKDAKLVWDVAKWVMTSEYCCDITADFPPLKIAYQWMTNGTPELAPDDAAIVYKHAEDISQHFDPEAIGFFKDDTETILIKDKYSGMEFWFHSWINENDHDVNCDWNQDIFSLTNEDDVLRKLLQEDDWVFDLVSSEALNYQEKMGVAYQWSNGDWHKTPEPQKAD